MNPIRALAACTRGSASVEAAVVIPLLLTLGLGAAEGGTLVFEQHKTKSGLAAGARLLARADDPVALEAQARNLAVTGRRTGGQPHVRGWSPNQVTVSYRWVANGDGVYTGAGQIRIVRLESTRPYRGLGLLRLASFSTVYGEHEERWTGG